VSLIIEPGRGRAQFWRDLWAYRELLGFLAWRDIAVRYKQTVIGVTWAVLRPALTMLVFVAFRRIAGLPETAIPEPILVFAAVLPWQFFSSALTESAGSLVGNSNLITKVYFPRVIVPCAAVTTSLVDFVISAGLLALLMLWYGFAPDWHLLALPLFIALAFAAALGAGLLLGALNVRYRDVRHVVPFIVQFGVFISPIAFSTSDVPEAWRTLYALNPMAGIIDGCRWAITGGHTPLDAQTLALSIGSTVALLVVGAWYFRRTEQTFADVI
jgi:lipopolysaccharide transport system permease protein